MLKARDFRYDAYQKLSGIWNTFALIALIYALVVGVLNVVPIAGSVAALVLGGPLTYGVNAIALNVIRRKNIAIEQLFQGFYNFINTMLLYLLNTIFTALWSLLFIIPGIVAAYSYRMSYFIMYDNPSIAPDAARKASIEMMRGNKWRLFCLDFSFIGWYLLSVLTFGILSFWVLPYHYSATAAFYQSLIAERYSEPSGRNFNGDNSDNAYNGAQPSDPFDNSGINTDSTF